MCPIYTLLSFPQTTVFRNTKPITGSWYLSGLSITPAPEQNGQYNSNKNIYTCIHVHIISPWHRIPTLNTFSKWVVLRFFMLFSPFPLERYHLSRNALWSIFRGSSYFARYFQWRSQVPQFVRFVQVSTIFFSEEAVNILWSILSRRHQRDTVFVSISEDNSEILYLSPSLFT